MAAITPLPKTVIFTAPQGWGKSTKAQQLLAEFGLTRLVDDEFWQPGHSLDPGTLYLTNIPPGALTKYTSLPGVHVVARGWA